MGNFECQFLRDDATNLKQKQVSKVKEKLPAKQVVHTRTILISDLSIKLFLQTYLDICTSAKLKGTKFVTPIP